ncbi:hypothetical protein C789_2571 [Microcystis aeruginosa FACHB-905 = DIANCHI905]|nr:hypothetical protein C789_2571 [Microcystis aeruginosa FACHB-905 = DIANCHI905]
MASVSLTALLSICQAFYTILNISLVFALSLSWGVLFSMSVYG